MSEFQQLLIDGMQGNGRVVITHLSPPPPKYSVPSLSTSPTSSPQIPRQFFEELPDLSGVSDETQSFDVASSGIIPEFEASSSTTSSVSSMTEHGDQDLTASVRAPLIPDAQQGTLIESEAAQLGPFQAINIVTAQNNAVSSYIESNERLRRHQRQAYDDQMINHLRCHMALSQPTRLAENVEVNAQPPIEMLPELAADMIRAVSAHLDVATEMVLISLLGTMFIAARGNFMVRVKNNHLEALTEYFAGAAAPGQRKSAVVSYFRAFFDDQERELRNAYAKEGNDTKYELSKNALASIKGGLSHKFTDMAKKVGFDLAQSTLAPQIVAYEKSAKSLRIAKHEPRLLTDLTTPEKLAEDLERQGEAIGMLVAEGGYWKRIISRYDDLILRAYTGEPYSSSTRSVASIFLQTPIMAICTLVQPNVLNALYGNEELTGHGLTPRILPVYIPSHIGCGTGSVEIPAQLHRCFEQKVRALVSLERPFTSENTRTFHILDIDNDGKAEISRYQGKIKAELASGSCKKFQPFIEKLAGHAVRLAGAVHLMNHNAPHNHLIDIHSVQAGIALAQFFRQHAEIAFTPEKRDGAVFARRILDRIVENLLVRFDTRQLQRGFHGATADQIRAGIEVLERHNFVRRYLHNGKTECVVHPHAHLWK